VQYEIKPEETKQMLPCLERILYFCEYIVKFVLKNQKKSGQNVRFSGLFNY